MKRIPQWLWPVLFILTGVGTIALGFWANQYLVNEHGIVTTMPVAP